MVFPYLSFTWQASVMGRAFVRWSLKAKLAGDTGKMKARVGSRMNEQACEMQANPIQFVHKM
jgi:hypothetical protein